MTQTTGTPSPGNSGDRLEQIEALLANVAKSHAASTQRLDRIEALQARTQEQIDSNAKAIQSWESRIEDGIAEAEEVTTSTTAELGQRIERDEDHYDEQIRRFDRLHEEHAQRFNNLLEEARADRQKSDERYQEWQRRTNEQQQEWQQRFDQQLSELREMREQAERERVINENEHRAFRETFQTLLAQISLLWQRVAG
jgi:chromosome segregation ATPase